MAVVHVIFQKEDVIPERLAGKDVVVFDVLLATTTITRLIEAGSLNIYPAQSFQAAEQCFEQLNSSSAILAGEWEGEAVQGYQLPLPTQLAPLSTGKEVVLVTTNGTVALHKAAKAHRTVAGCLLNGQALADSFVNSDRDLVLICAGSSEAPALEDTFGAGRLLALLSQAGDKRSWTDAAVMAFSVYKQHDPKRCLASSMVGQMFQKAGLAEETSAAALYDTTQVIPELQTDGQYLKIGGCV
ncbi:2-phosphosulfolactate phosphatase [Salsuginibacillus halophilus]|uniref:Probable 2-phosphosulfolactate phosphatase n=1 Tax=Salsuginibacillus halophilus TaxID=517424 RepID=A0A2P8HBL9_9BACI|nr:2-phosphosulfolactate phosphatase [Salsuginibacillus halophilus]PSL43613.1 2-phosphosulfolactate phosphatase [Salsuginibacillus halophilus]